MLLINLESYNIAKPPKIIFLKTLKAISKFNFKNKYLKTYHFQKHTSNFKDPFDGVHILNQRHLKFLDKKNNIRQITTTTTPIQYNIWCNTRISSKA